jgi:hypothetical protein
MEVVAFSFPFFIRLSLFGISVLCALRLLSAMSLSLFYISQTPNESLR